MEHALRMFEYDSFLSKQMLEQVEMERYIEECVLISEGQNTLKNIRVLNEGFTDKFKEVIKKILAAIAKMWGKFLEAMNTLILRDQKYLEKYKEIILRKKPKEKDYTMFDYKVGQARLQTDVVPAFNYSTQKSQLASDAEFIKEAGLSKFMADPKSTEYRDQFKAYFRGSASEITVSSNQFNFTSAYEYCYGYKNMETKLKNDLAQIQKAAVTAMDLVDTMYKAGEIKESASILESGKYYSHVYEQYITELTKEEIDKMNQTNGGTMEERLAKQKADKEAAAKAAQNGTPSTDPKPAGGVGIENKNVDGTNQTDAYTNKSAIQSGDDKEQTAKENTDRIHRYMNICGAMLGAKQTISEEIYKAYMTIIRDHVRDYVGTKDAKDNRAKDPSTNKPIQNVDKGDGKSTGNNSSEAEKIMADAQIKEKPKTSNPA